MKHTVYKYLIEGYYKDIATDIDDEVYKSGKRSTFKQAYDTIWPIIQKKHPNLKQKEFELVFKDSWKEQHSAY